VKVDRKANEFKGRKRQLFDTVSPYEVLPMPVKAPDGPRVLSIRQPWAWAIATGKKKVENRTWTTPYRGTVFIHASLSRASGASAWLSKHFRLTPPADLPRGAIIAVAVLDKVVTRRNGKAFGKWFEGPYGFVLTDVRPVKKPIMAAGKLGLWRPSASLRRKLPKAVGSRL